MCEENKKEYINIVELIEQNPISKLSNTYSGRFLNKIKDNFSSFEQQLFIGSFYCYLKYDKKKDYVINLDDIWKWLGFTQKVSAKRLLEKQFIENIDYIFLFDLEVKQKGGSGGHNKETIMLNIKTFKSLCLKSGTKKADEIHEYFIKLEEILHDVINEESQELRLQLENKNSELIQKSIEFKQELEQTKIKSEIEKKLLREKTLLQQFPKNVQCIYYGIIDNKSISGENLIKFGNSNNLQERVDTHKKTYDNFILYNVFKVSNKIQIENAIKNHLILKKKRRGIMINNKNYTELLAINDYTFDEIDNMIEKIIEEYEYNVENYIKTLEINKILNIEISTLKEENEKLKKEKIELETKLNEFTPPAFKNINNTSILGFNNTSKYGFLLYAFECREGRYNCGIIRAVNVDDKMKLLKSIEPNGKLVYSTHVSYPFSEKNMLYMLKDRLLRLGNDYFDGNITDIKQIFNITAKIEEIIIDKNSSLDDIYNKLTQQFIPYNKQYHDPEIPIVRKAKRSIDQINPVTGDVIATYESIEAAGRSLSLVTGSAIGIALRNKTLCKGFSWRYSGISHDDQFSDQPVLKVCCNSGQKTYFKNIADAARDCNISSTGLRQRILTDVHVNGYHWIFNKDSSHYTMNVSNNLDIKNV